MKLYYDIKDKPKFPQLVVYAIQQLLAIMAATLVVPIIIGNGMQPSAALFGAGVGTLVYVAFTKANSPVFLGSSFAFLGSMGAAFAGAVSAQAGYAGIILGAVFAGLVYVAIALVVKFAGVAWIDKLMPKQVIGPSAAACRPPAHALTMGGCWEQISCREATHLLIRAGHHLDAHGQSGQSHTLGCGSFYVSSGQNAPNLPVHFSFLK